MPAINVAVDEITAIAAERADTPADAPGRDARLRSLGLTGAALAELADVLDHPVAEAVLYGRATSTARCAPVDPCSMCVTPTPGGW